MNRLKEIDYTVTKLQIFMFLFVLQAGTTFINLQYRMINASGHHAWLVFLGVCIVHLFIFLFYIKAGKYFHPTKVELFLFQLYWSYLIVVFLAKIVFIAHVWVFQETPSWVILALIGLVMVYSLSAHGSVALNLPVLLGPFFILLISSLFLSWSELTWLNLLPLSGLTLKEVALGAFQALSAFCGMEALLFLQKNLSYKNRIRPKHISLFMLVFSSFLTLSILFTLLFFSLKEIKVVPFALMYLLKSQEVTFIERIDLIFIYLWISWSIVSVVLYGFLIFRTEGRREPSFLKSTLVIGFICILASFFITRYEIRLLHDGMLYLSPLFSLLLPVIIMARERWKSNVQARN